MNIRINQSQFDKIDLMATYAIADTSESESVYVTNTFGASTQGTLIPELVFRHNEWHYLVTLTLMMYSAGIMAIVTHEMGFFQMRPSLNSNFFYDNWIVVAILLFYSTIFYLSIKHFCDLRYLIFQDDKVILQSRYTGRRAYAAKDLTFLLLRFGWKYHRYQLEVEIPDSTLPETRRRLILETAADLDTMNGILAVLFPLMRGDTDPYLNAKKRPYFELTQDEKSTPWKLWQNFQTHLHVWFLNYKVNEILFKIVHGSREKLLAKEKQRDAS